MQLSRLTIAELDELFMEAAETERKLPAAMRKQKMSGWPDYPRDYSAYGYNAFEVPMLKATPDQVSRYDAALNLVLTKLDEEDRRLVWAVAASAAYRQRGPRWTKLAVILGLNDPRIVKQRYKDALIRLYYML
tara:strand:- start:1282 stop:1680 length:399 start_codon:yes stop_codon:yes gene_type:complete